MCYADSDAAERAPYITSCMWGEELSALSSVENYCVVQASYVPLLAYSRKKKKKQSQASLKRKKRIVLSAGLTSSG